MLRMDYTNYRDFYETYDKQLDKAHNAVVGLAQKVGDLFSSGVLSGEIHNELIVYKKYVDDGAKLIDEVQKLMVQLVQNYLDDMNDAQRIGGKYILYDKDYPDIRDYTAESFRSMAADCESTSHDANIFEAINDFGEDLACGLLNFLGKTFGWFDARQTRFLVMEVNEITERRLKEIQIRIDSREKKYADKAEKLYQTMFDVNQYIYKLQQIITWRDGYFSASSFSTVMTELYNQIQNRITSVNVNSVVTMEDIQDFLELDLPEHFFKSSEAEIYAYLAKLAQTDWADWDMYTIIMTQMFDIASEAIKGHFMNYTYDEFLLDREMLSLLDEMAEREDLYADTDMETLVTTMQKLYGLVEKYGNKWGDYLNTLRDENGDLLLDKRTKEYKMFKAFFDQFGDAEKILDYGEKIVKIVAKYAADYETCEKILISMKDKCGNDPEILASLNRIQKVYDKSIESIVRDVFSEGFDKAISALEKYSDKAMGTSIFKTVGLIEMGIDITGKITGISEEAEAKMHLLTTGYTQMNSAKAAYENALTALQACDPCDEAYEECATTFRHCFEYYRVTQKRVYAQMGKAENGVLGDYYRYCSEEMDDLSLNNFKEFKLMTYEEYAKLSA